MMKSWVENYSDIQITMTGLFLFLTVFLSMLAITFHKDRKAYFEKIQNLPLGENTLQPEEKAP